MDTVAALEVVAENVSWRWDMRCISNDTLAAGFSHVSIRAASLFMECEWKGRGWNAPAPPSPEEALLGIMRNAPPSMRTCSLCSLSAVEGATQTWDLEMISVYESDPQPHELECNPYSPAHRDRTTCFYQSAGKLAERTKPLAVAKRIEVLLKEQSQEVLLTRLQAA